MRVCGGKILPDAKLRNNKVTAVLLLSSISEDKVLRIQQFTSTAPPMNKTDQSRLLDRSVTMIHRSRASAQPTSKITIRKQKPKYVEDNQKKKKN